MVSFQLFLDADERCQETYHETFNSGKNLGVLPYMGVGDETMCFKERPAYSCRGMIKILVPQPEMETKEGVPIKRA